jgi:hypothetical protein
MVEPISMLAVGGTIGVIYYFTKKQREKQKQRWMEAAALVGGEFEDTKTAWYQGSVLKIRATIDGMGVHVDHYTVSTGKSSQIYTRLIAIGTGTPHLKLSVHKAGFFSSLGKAFGTQDVIVGDQMFDDAFIVKASDETLCKEWITQEARDQMLLCQEYSFSIKGREGLATRTGIEEIPEKMAAAIRAMAAYAGGGKKLTERVQQTAEELRGAASFEPNFFVPEKTQIEWNYKNFSCLLTFTEREQNLFQESSDVMTCIKLRHMGRGRHFFMTRHQMPRVADALPEATFQDRNFGLEHRLRSQDPEVGMLFQEEVTEKLLRLPMAGINSDEHFVTLWLSGIVLSAASIQTACDAIAPFVTTPEIDPYR